MLNKTVLALAISASISGSALAADKYQKYNFTNQEKIALETGTISLDDRKQTPTTWLIKLNSPSLSELAVNNQISKSASTSAIANIEAAQKSVISDISQLSNNVKVLAQTRNLISGVVVQGNVEALASLRNNSSVVDILPIYDYEANVTESAKYMNGAALVEAGVASGKGIRVAVLDTGVDYTHAAMGGEGTEEAYAAATADVADTPAWPQGSVIGGYDFINNDPDPIDFGTNHGTHVSHSVLGLAPEAELYVYSVCSNVSCPGAAQFAALEAAMDPNGDGDISDRVDVINMSLGGDFGTTRGGAVQEMLDNAANLGVISAVSAGNDGPTPFIVGGPSTTKSVMSVGAMTHPTTEATNVEASFNGGDIIMAPAGFNPTNVFSFTSEETSLVYPDENQNGCSAFADGTDFTGKVVIIDRGACNFTAKVINAQDKGAVFVLIANHTEGAGAPGLGGSDDAVMIPSAGISYEDGMAMKEALKGSTAPSYSFVSESIVQPGAIASFTSRGPSSDGYLKPEITAPGVNIDTAHPGLGDGLTPISGTSFSSPMTAGAMALLREALPNRNALEIKATLMNSANLDVTMEARSVNEDAALAPISYIGAGLVDVEKASNLPVAAWDKDTNQAALAFGLMNLSETTKTTKTITIKNFSSNQKTYTISVDERFKNDTESGALDFAHPGFVRVPAGGSIDIDVSVTVDPSKLHKWSLTAAELESAGGTENLTDVEYDGAIVFTDGNDNFHVVYHLLPKASASIEASQTVVEDKVVRTVTNNGVTDLETFTVPLTVEDAVGDSSYLDLQAASVEVLSVPSDFCTSGYLMFNTFTMTKGMLSLNTGGFYADIDVDSDGAFDYSMQAFAHNVFSDSNPAGRTITFTSAWGTFSGAIDSTYFTSGNNFATLSTCIESIGLSADDLGTSNATIRFRVSDSQWDFYDSSALDVATVSGIDFAVSNELAMLVDDEGNEVETLAVGESANLLTAGQDFVMLSDSGAHPLVAKPTQQADIEPVITAGQVFSIDENSANDTEIGKVAVDPILFSNPIVEFVTQSSTSAAVMIDADGTIKVADSTLLDYDAGLTSIALQVTAIDTEGNMSNVETVTVNVNNLADEPSEQPAPVVPAPLTKPSGGTTGIIALLLLPLALIRRRK